MAEARLSQLVRYRRSLKLAIPVDLRLFLGDTPVTEAPTGGASIGAGSSPPSSSGLAQVSPPSSPRAGDKHSVPAMG